MAYAFALFLSLLSLNAHAEWMVTCGATNGQRLFHSQRPTQALAAADVQAHCQLEAGPFSPCGRIECIRRYQPDLPSAVKRSARGGSGSGSCFPTSQCQRAITPDSPEFSAYRRSERRRALDRVIDRELNR